MFCFPYHILLQLYIPFSLRLTWMRGLYFNLKILIWIHYSYWFFLFIRGVKKNWFFAINWCKFFLNGLTDRELSLDYFPTESLFLKDEGFFHEKVHNTTQNCILENEDITMGIWFAKLAGHTVDASRSLKNPHVVASYALFFGFIGFILLVWISAFVLTIVRICKKYSNARKHDETHRTVRKLSLWRFVNQTQCWLTKKLDFPVRKALHQCLGAFHGIGRLEDE